jgi:hypothetical protein
MNHREKDKRFCTCDILLCLGCNYSIQRKQIVQQNFSYWLNKIIKVLFLLDNFSLYKILRASFSFLRPLWSVISKFVVLCKSRFTQIYVNGTENKHLWPDCDRRMNDLVPQVYLSLEQRLLVMKYVRRIVLKSFVANFPSRFLSVKFLSYATQNEFLSLW